MNNEVEISTEIPRSVEPKKGDTKHNEVKNDGGSIVETPKKGCWRKLLEVAETCLSYKDKDKWLKQMRGYLGLMATVIAAMTFQMALNPPGGVRSVRDDSDTHPSSSAKINPYAYPPGADNGYADSPDPSNVDTVLYRTCGNFGTYRDLCPGEAVIGTTFPDLYFRFLVSNTICFVASISVCLLFVSGIPLNHRFPMWMLSIGMCVTLTSLAVSYLIALELTAPSDVYDKADKFLQKFLYAWAILVAIVGLWHILRLVFWVVKLVVKGVKLVISGVTSLLFGE